MAGESMKRESISFSSGEERVEALLWGERSASVLLAVHAGAYRDDAMAVHLAAEQAARRGMCTLSLDITAGGGERLPGGLIKHAMLRLWTVYSRVQRSGAQVCAFACSLATYVLMLLYPQMVLSKCLLLSPIVEPERVLRDSMRESHVTQEQLRLEGGVHLADGRYVSWEDFCFVCEHELRFAPKCPISIFTGALDTFCPPTELEAFASHYGAQVQLLPGVGRGLMTQTELDMFSQWLRREL